MENENVASDGNCGAKLDEPVIGNEAPESIGFNHNNDDVWQSIGLDPNSLDENMDKFCDIMNQFKGGGKVSQGVETIMKTFSYKEVCFLAFKGLELANTLQIEI